jgi:cyclic pyranopterin phosphate synthase
MLRVPLPLSADLRLPSAPRTPHPALLDTFGRIHNNLRISVTDRCNLRCTYCMPEDVEFLHRSELLSFEEIAAFVRVAAELGIDKVRLTGGEPLMRRDLPELVRMIAGIPGIRDIGLTTNGLLLEKHAQPLFEAGLGRLNVSLDTLDEGRFFELSRRDGLPQVLAGLAAAKRAGFHPIKVNAVAIRGFIDHDAVPLARYCREMGFELRFIESMPIGAEAWEREKVVFAAELQALLSREVSPLVPHWMGSGKNGGEESAPAVDFDYADGCGRVGFIASVSQPFCGSCNRLRLTADGKLRNCLFARDEVDVKGLLRTTPLDAEALKDAIRANVWAKWEGHEINSPHFVKPDRTMHAIGG